MSAILGNGGVWVGDRFVHNLAPSSRAFTDSAITQSQFATNPLLTSLVGFNPARSSLLGDVLFTEVVSETINFKYPRFKDSHLVVRNARRALKGEFKRVQTSWEEVPGSLHRYGLAAEGDRDEFENSAAFGAATGITFDRQTHYASLSFEGVRLSKEADRAAIALAAASYDAANDVTLTSGIEWNHQTGGDPRGNIRLRAQAIAGAVGRQPRDCELIVTDSSLAALEDAPDIKARTVGASSSPGLAFSLDDLARYLGIGRVIHGDAYSKADDHPDTAQTSLYGDVAFLRVMPERSGVIAGNASTFNSLTRFSWGGFGFASEPIYEAERTTWLFPWESWEEQAVINSKVHAIFRNTNKDV